MKKVKKLILLCFCITLCVLLCSCNKIDELRKTQAFVDGEDTISFNGESYKLLPACDDFNLTSREYTDIYITEKDVPLLLMSQLGKGGYITDDGMYITSHFATNYARTDVYKSVADRIESGDYFDGYAFEYDAYYFDEETKEDEWEHRYKMLSAEATDAITDIFTYGIPVTDLINIYDNIYNLSDYNSLDLMLSSDDFLFQRYTATIHQTFDGIYLSVTNSVDGENFYLVPDKYMEIFKDIMTQYSKLNGITSLS